MFMDKVNNKAQLFPTSCMNSTESHKNSTKFFLWIFTKMSLKFTWKGKDSEKSTWRTTFEDFYSSVNIPPNSQKLV